MPGDREKKDWAQEIRKLFETTQNPTPTPEFPSILLPGIMIIEFLGAILLIQRTREH